jgi:hypothetical protein
MKATINDIVKALHTEAIHKRLSNCAKCGRYRLVHDYNGGKWFGTCISRHERRINCREMNGQGRRGY